MAEFSPTAEQQACLEAFDSGNHMVIEAGAGTGKTSTLKLLANATQHRGIYVAYNRAIANDARESFPDNVECATAHSFAFRAVGKDYEDRLNAPRMKPWDFPKHLRLFNMIEPAPGMYLSAMKQGRLIRDGMARFCYSSDQQPEWWHIPNVNGLEPDQSKALRLELLPYLRKYWEDVQSKSGRLPFTHDMYLKIWALGEPELPASFILFDEAQDANQVIADLVLKQDAQLIAVGDQSQAIYGWRGAVDAMANWPAAHRLQLSQSFRFGPAVADEANKWLALLDAPLRLSGYEKINSVVTNLDEPNAILCRTNAEVVARALGAQERAQDVAIVGGTTEILRFAEAAAQLQANQPTNHPDLMLFNNWGEVQAFVADGDAPDLKVFVNAIDTHGVERVMNLANNTVGEDEADVIVSTAHKAKGREWRAVKIGNDFTPPSGEDEEPSRAELMLAYVAVTRAKKKLDVGALDWVDSYVKLLRKEVDNVQKTSTVVSTA
jgi:AAA domain/UvrD-like helicase C-terminal domain